VFDEVTLALMCRKPALALEIGELILGDPWRGIPYSLNFCRSMRERSPMLGTSLNVTPVED
jgi:hypothetical protein